MLTRKSLFVVFLLALTSMSFATTFTCTGTNNVVVNGTDTSISVTVPTNYSIVTTNPNTYAFKYGSQTIFTASFSTSTIIVPEGGPAGDPDAGGEVQTVAVTTYTFSDGSKVYDCCNMTTETAMNPTAQADVINKLTVEQYDNYVNLASGIDSISDIQPCIRWKCLKLRLKVGWYWFIGNKQKEFEARWDLTWAGC